MKLHKLSTGNWIDLKTVISIAMAERVQCWPGGPIYPVRIIVRFQPGSETQPQVIPCDDESQALTMMDELAALVNEACK